MKSIVREISDEELQQIVDNTNSLSSILRAMGIKSVTSRCYRIDLKKRLKTLDTTKYENNKNKKSPFHNGLKSYSNSQMFKENCEADVKTVKARYIQLYPQENCSICGQDKCWNGKELNLHLDHVNGINNDNRLKNLRWLCPNCHSQTPTYTGRNKTRI